MKQTKPVEQMDWEERLIELYTHSSNYEDVVDFVKEIRAEAITTAVKEEKERTKQVVRQAQIAMEYIEDDEQVDWCLARFDAMLDEDLKLQQPK